MTFYFYPSVTIITGNNFEWNQLFVFFNFRRIKTTANQTLNCKQCIFRVSNSLTFCGSSDQTFIIRKSNNRRGCSCTFAVFQNFGVFAFHNGKARVGCTQINTNNFIAHNLFPSLKPVKIFSTCLYREQKKPMQEHRQIFL